MLHATDPILAAPRGARLRWFVQLGLTVLFVGALAWRLDVMESLAVLRHADPLWVAAALATAVLDRVWMIGKWLPLLAVQAPVIGRARAARSYLAAGFTNYFLPATVGSDALRAASLGRPHGMVAEVAASIAAERMLGAAANALLVLLALHVGLSRVVSIPGLEALTVLLAVALVGGFWLPFHPAIRSWLGRAAAGRFSLLAARFAEALLAYRHVPLTIAAVFVATLVEVFFPITVGWMLSRSLAVDVSFATLVVAVPISGLVGKLPISIAGVGPQDASLVSLLIAFGVSPEQALALAIPCRVIEIAVAIPGAWMMRELWRDLRTRPAIGRAVAVADPGCAS
jgi:uncharacterized membrane protein YbhN (UPF0104 family)